MTQPAIGIAVNLPVAEPELQHHSLSIYLWSIELAELAEIVLCMRYAGMSLHVTVIATSSIRNRSYGLETTK